MKYIPLSVKLRTFAPQFGLIAIGTGAGMGIAALPAASVVAMVPLCVTAAVSAVVLAISTFVKMDAIERQGWPEFDRECGKCRGLASALLAAEKDRDETRRALAELKIP